MKCKRTGGLAAVAVIALVAGIALAAWAGLLPARSALRVGYLGRGGHDSWSASYVLLDGTMRKTLRPEAGTLQVEAETEAGTLSMEIWDQDGTLLFSRADLGNAAYTVDAPGPVTVRVGGNRHKGGFSIRPS